MLTNVYLKGITTMSYRQQEAGQVIGMKSVYNSETSNYDICYVVSYEDQDIEFIPSCDLSNYKFLTESEILLDISHRN